MPLEKESYRDNLERIMERYPSREMLRVSEVMELTGLGRKPVRRIFEFNNGYISVAKLARMMS